MWIMFFFKKEKGYGGPLNCGGFEVFLRDRARYHSVTDTEAMNAMKLLSQTEGIIPAIETAHGLAGIEHLAKVLPAGAHILINLSGRGDKDMETAAKYFGLMGDK